MSISEIAQITDTNSEEYLLLISSIYMQFEDLSKKMKRYSVTESLFYIKLAKKCFEEAVAEDLRTHP
ncbi:MAG: hypothetical protein IJ660_07350 [Alphaproteobacteria bacterium]|nr:hypothetical protein [Alphaproteobacteria bacterium]